MPHPASVGHAHGLVLGADRGQGRGVVGSGVPQLRSARTDGQTVNHLGLAPVRRGATSRPRDAPPVSTNVCAPGQHSARQIQTGWRCTTAQCSSVACNHSAPSSRLSPRSNPSATPQLFPLPAEPRRPHEAQDRHGWTLRYARYSLRQPESMLSQQMERLTPPLLHLESPDALLSHQKHPRGPESRPNLHTSRKRSELRTCHYQYAPGSTRGEVGRGGRGRLQPGALRE